MSAVELLPEEVWLLVFEYLPTPDKFSVRSSCKLFRRLIDRPTFWRNTTVYLDKITSYKPHFWKTLRQRKTSSVVALKASGVREWTEISSRLPWLCSLSLHLCSDPKGLETLGLLKNLKRLDILQCRCPNLASLTSLVQLTRISLCEIVRAPRTDVYNAVSQLTNLTSIYYHENKNPIPRTAFHNILRCLPNLKRLSLKMGANQSPLPSDYFCPNDTNQMSGEPKYGTLGLTSLELLNYMDPMVSPTALQSIPSLKSLTVQYRCWVAVSSLCPLKSWLSTLPSLAELSISYGYELGAYAKSVPGTVQNLQLKAVVGELEDVREIALKVPDLLCLHLDLYCRNTHSYVAELPQLFPKLQSLKIRSDFHLQTQQHYRERVFTACTDS
ncbi:uncharacterized protein im:7136021 isoform X2 [Hoplias malabaricus]|uniref:uncharacterized protein im:7136021 isoform X2 n=1 Tax=Hoplias malabaricus TaxID=27720 RepID=UPI0034631C6D